MASWVRVLTVQAYQLTFSPQIPKWKETSTYVHCSMHMSMYASYTHMHAYNNNRLKLSLKGERK